MKTLLALLVLSLTGCAGFDTLTQTAVKTSENSLEKEAATAEFVICNAIPVGTWRVMYGRSAERSQAWTALCSAPAVSPKTNP